MRLGVSNLAWDIVEDNQICELLKSQNIDAIDIAPGKYFNDFRNVSERDILAVKEQWLAHDIEITGMQSLLFGTVGLNLFGDELSKKLMLSHLAEVCRIGRILGAKRLVFGSPKNRDRQNLSDKEALQVAKEFFTQLGDVALQEGVTICLEPNPVNYGSNFMTHHQETLDIVKMVDHKSIKMQIDMGALVINGEGIESILLNENSYIGHVHASEPDLLPFGDNLTSNHYKIANMLKANVPDHIVTIEMLQTQKEPHVESIKRSIIAAKKLFLPETVL